MKVKALKPFIDAKEGVTRNVGDIFPASEERHKELCSTKFGALVEAVAEETVKPKARKKPTKKG